LAPNFQAIADKVMIVPFKYSFDRAKKCDHYSNISLYIATFIIFISFVFPYAVEKHPKLYLWIDAINCLFIISFSALRVISQYIFYKASHEKRADFIDNSFGTSLAENKSVGYFSNDDITSGIYKLAVNGFENSLYTYNIAKKMMFPIWLKNSVFIIVFMFLAILGFSNIIVLIIQLTLPYILIHQAIKHTIFVTKMQEIFKDYKKLFYDLRYINKEIKIPQILLSVIDYECALSWGSVLLDDKIYNALHDDLAKKWDEMKIEYNIQ
jgi:hypothetical protein